MESSGLTTRHASRWITGVALLIGLSIAAGQEPGETVTARLDRIREYLEADNPNQRTASVRLLQEELRTEDLEEFRTYLMRPLRPGTLQSLRLRYEELLEQKISSVEDRIVRFDQARRAARTFLAEALAEEAASREGTDGKAPPDAGDPSTKDPAPETNEPEPRGADGGLTLRESYEVQRLTRDRERDLIGKEYRLLRRQGVAVAPVLWRRLQESASESLSVDRFRARLQSDLIDEVRTQYPSAPRGGAISPFEERALVPLIEVCHPADPEGWDAFRERVANVALARFDTLLPDDRDAARATFLELGEWGRARLHSWAESDAPGAGERVPQHMRRAYATWNELALPVGLERRMGMAVEQYFDREPEERIELVHRLEWIAGKDCVPVLVRLLELDPDVNVRVQAAAVLLEHDPRGAEYLRRLGYAGAAEWESVSKRALIVEAVQKREAGDARGAMEDLEQVLRRFPGDFDVNYELAMCALAAKDWPTAIRHFEIALRYDPENANAHYNLACALALSGQPDRALRTLRYAVDAGFRNADHIANDADLESLRGIDAFQDILRELTR